MSAAKGDEIRGAQGECFCYKNETMKAPAAGIYKIQLKLANDNIRLLLEKGRRRDEIIQIYTERIDGIN